MEKIQIHFNESDYKVYYDYCLRYYQNHGLVRKQSIHAFLDLFEKGAIPLDEQDIGQTRKFLSNKCDALKKVQRGLGGEGDTTMLLQIRICTDFLLLVDDIEKLFRLIQKQGVGANYLMILGTFSKVIEENRNSQISGMYDLDHEVIESLARPLVEIIQLRLGTDRQWRSALRELTFIAARFNQMYTEPEFEMDIILLVAPFVIAHINKDVETREILSLVPSYYKESELEEFEAFLNRTPEILRDDQNAEIDWEAIYEPLCVVASEVTAQRDQWSQGRLKISDHYAPVSPIGIPYLGGDGGLYQSGGPMVPAPSGLPQTMGYKTFDVAVSRDITTQMDAPIRVYPMAEPGGSKKSDLQPFIPVIIGVSVIILFIIATLALYGGGDLFGMGNTTNSTPVAFDNVTPATPTPTPKPTTAPPATTPAKTPVPTPKSYTSSEIGSHLVEIAFNPDTNVIQKPDKDLVGATFSGKFDDSDLLVLYTVINRFDNYSSTTKISSNVNLNSPADIWIVFLPEDSIRQIRVDEDSVTYKDFQTGTIYFLRSRDPSTDVLKTYVNSNLKGDERKRWIARAILYEMGFCGETAKYSDSLFYAGPTTVTELSDIDLKAIQLMYGKKVTNGMTRSSVKSIVG